MDKLGRDLASIFNNISNTNHFLGDFNSIDAEALKRIGECTNLGADQRQKYNQLNSGFQRLQRSLGVLYGALAPSA